MNGLGRWLPDPLDAGPFRFGRGGPPRHRVVRRVVKPSPDGPVYTGDYLTREPGTPSWVHHHDPGSRGRLVKDWRPQRDPWWQS